MTKTEKRRAINRSLFDYINEHYPKFSIDEDDGGRVIIYDAESNTWDDSIEYHRSSHTFATLNWADDSVKRIEEELETYVDTLMRMYELG